MKTFDQKLGNRKGFTLMELLVAIGIFVTFLGVVTSSYVSIVRGHESTNERRKMIADVRYFIDFVTDELRDGTVEYKGYCVSSGITAIENLTKNENLVAIPGFASGTASLDAASNPYAAPAVEVKQEKCADTRLGKGLVNELVIVSKDGQRRTSFRIDKDKKRVQVKKEILKAGTFAPVDGFADFRDFGLENAQVDSLNFIVTPLDDPYASRSYQYAALQFQPKVTMLLSAGIPVDDGPAEQPVHLQTTISSRLYSSQSE